MITQFLGGPHDGQVCETHGAAPVVFDGKPRGRSLLDHPLRTASWSEENEWYEAAHFAGIPVIVDPDIPWLLKLVYR